MRERAGQVAVGTGLVKQLLGFCSKAATAPAPAAQRSGGSSVSVSSWTLVPESSTVKCVGMTAGG